MRPRKMKKSFLSSMIKFQDNHIETKRTLMKLKNISLETTNKVLSCHSGLVLFENLWEQLNLNKKLRRLLPKKKKKRGVAQLDKVKGILFSFALGNDCIDDLEELRSDAVFIELLGGELAARTAGGFLAGFHKRQIEKIQDVLLETAIHLRLSMWKDPKFILSMDSTPHKQSGKKMEKLAENYKGIWGFDSQNAYDQYGLSYLFDLRPGNTWTGTDAEKWIHKIFSKIPDHMERWFRADSGYSSNVIFGALKTAEVKYTIVLKDNIGRYVRNKNRDHLNWKKTEIEFFGSNKCEISMGLYPLKSLGNLRVVFIRRKKEDEDIERQLDLLKEYNPEEDDYKHYSIITNIDSSEMNNVEIIEFYRGRANCENYIKEQKHNFDFLHFPCKKFEANQAWGLIGTLAHNMMRFLSFCMDQKIKKVRGKNGVVRTVVQEGYFAKKVRNTLIKIPCQVVRSARRVKLKMKKDKKEVLEKIMKKIERMFSLDTVFT